ncbi:MAG: PKD domain-containing protein [Bacteroidetes bacterium]|nr:PKD domain-containing protein [Bacteroidota bacterium]
MKQDYLTFSVLKSGALTLILGLMSFVVSAQSPVAGFTTSVQQGCAPLSVNFTNTSSGASSYQWIFGNGNFSSLANPQNVYVNPGTYSVSLIAIAANGTRDTLTMSNYITAAPGPTPSFTVDGNSGCAGQDYFTFTNSSVGAVSYFWDFDDGTSSLQANPTKQYSVPGTYHVSLLATNANGCESVYNLNQNITVNPVPVAAFTVNHTQVCSPAENFTFSSSTPGNNTYLWNFGDGTTSTQANPSKTYQQSGIYTVSLVVTNNFGCSDTLTRNNYVTVYEAITPQINATVLNGCVPLITQVSTNVTGASSIAWDFGNGTTSTAASQTVNYAQAGVYSPQVTVTMPNGCSYTNTATNLIEAYPKPVAQFTLTNNIGCAPVHPIFNNTTTGGSTYLWQFQDGQSSTDFEPDLIFEQSGNWYARLTATSSHGCTNILQISQAIRVNSPNADFTANNNSGCPPLNVVFSSNTNPAGNYLWNFGDGTTSTAQNPSHVYNQLGIYDVTLIITNGTGCSDTVTYEGLVNASNEVAVYTPPAEITACSPFTASFEIEQEPGETYTWDFGDGYTTTGTNPIHIYTEPGEYVVSLLVNNGSPCGMIYPEYQTIIVEGQQPDFDVTVDICPPHAVHFSADTTDIVSWLWNFGDGTTSTAESPVHVYPNMLSHHVSLQVTTTNGCEYSFIEFNAVNFSTAMATFTSTFEPGDFPQTVSFTSTNPYATSWMWNFGDGNISTEENPVHTYLTEGDYEVTLQITTEDCILFGAGDPFDAVSQDVDEGTSEGGSYPIEGEIPPNPITGCAPITISFLKQDPAHNVIQWFFGDGTSSTESNPTHMYTQAGYYTVFYTAMTNTGFQTIQYDQAVLLGGGVPNFTVAETPYCDYSTVDVAIDNPGAIDEILWNFGGMGTATTPQASWDFPFANSAYTVQVTLTDTMGCHASRMKSLLVSPPIPEIYYPATVCRDTIQFTHNLADEAGYTYLWDFGDGTTSTDIEPYHYYTWEDTFFVHVTITSPEGCVNSFDLETGIRVGYPIISYTINSPLEGCVPYVFSIQNTGIYNAAFFYSNGAWSGQEIPAGQNSSMSFTVPGEYQFTQLSKSRILPGCNVSEMSDSIIRVYDATADFSFTQIGLCDPIQAQFVDSSEDAVSWLWDFGDGTTSTEQNPSLTFNTFPADSISLTIVNSHGCTATATRAGLATLEAEAEASFTGNCNPLPVTFSASQDGMISWEWDFGDGTGSDEAEPYHLYTENGTYTVTVIVTSSELCRDTVTLSVPIDVTGPTADFSSPTPANCAPSVVEFFDYSTGAVEWLWDFGDGTTSTEQNPVKLYDNPGVYDVQLISYSAMGCADTLFRPEYVTVLGPATSFTASAVSACVGATVDFTDLSNGAVEWEWNFGEGTSSTIQNPSFTYTEEGSFTVTLFSKDTLGCDAFYTIPLPIEIHPYPTAAFSISDTTGCAPLAFSTENQSEGAVSYQWFLNGSDFSTSAQPDFSLNQPGVYMIDMIATNQFGCSDTATFSGIESFMVPVANFTILQTEGCTPLSVTFNNESYQTVNPQYLWDFGNGNTSTEVSPTEVYYDPDFYSVSLTVTNESGCADSILLPSIIQVYDTLPAPVTPILRVTVENEQAVRIDWEESLTPDFGAYVIMRKNLQTGIFEQLTAIEDPHVVTFLDGGLNTLNNVYCYKLQTLDRCGYNIETDSLIEHCSINIETAITPEHTIQVDWTPYIGKMPSQYRVYRTEENTNLKEDLGTVAGDVTSYTDSSVFCPAKYKYEVTAEGLDGQWHVESNSDYDISDRLPNLFEFQQVNASRSTVVENRFVLTEWREPEIMGNRVNGYKVFRSTDNQQFFQIANLHADQTFFIDEDVDVNHIKYFYRIMATNSCGLEGIEGGFSDNVVITAEPAGEFYIQLEWTPYTGWGEDGVDFYILERETDDGSWEVIHELPGNVTTAVDEN